MLNKDNVTFCTSSQEKFIELICIIHKNMTVIKNMSRKIFCKIIESLNVAVGGKTKSYLVGNSNVIDCQC